MKSSEAGFTLTELMVAIIVGSLIVSFSYTLYMFTDHLVASWKRSSDIRQMAERTVRLIASDIERAKFCSELSDSSLIVLQGIDKTIRYTFSHGTVYRNGDPVNPDSIMKIIASVRRAGKDFQICVLIKEDRMEYSAEARARMLESGKEEFNTSRAGQ